MRLLPGEGCRVLHSGLSRAALSLGERYWRVIDESNRVPDEVIDELREAGAFEPEAVGLVEVLEAVRAAARFSPALAHVILVSASAWLASGGRVSGVLAFSITEPGGGTDVLGNLATRAEARGDRYEVTGVKVFTSNAPYADYYVVLARGPEGPTLYYAPRQDAIKYELLDVTGLRGAGASRVEYSNATAYPAGEPGRGLKEALRGINLGRAGYGMISLGIVDRALEILINTASTKEVFGRKLIEYQGVRWTIASLASRREMLDALMERVLSELGRGELDPVKAAIAKVEGARLAQDAAWAAAQILGGRGLTRGSETERMGRDARVLDIGEGAREVLLDFIGSRVAKKGIS